MSMEKDQTTRVQECINVKHQLMSMGVFVVEDIQRKVTKHMNEYIKEGRAQSFSLQVPNSNTSFKIILTTNVNKQSGVYMYQ